MAKILWPKTTRRCASICSEPCSASVMRLRPSAAAPKPCLCSRPNSSTCLTDIVMPEMDGIELAQKASAIDPAIQVMFITGFAAVALQGGRTAPEAKLLSKPFPPQGPGDGGGPHFPDRGSARAALTVLELRLQRQIEIALVVRIQRPARVGLPIEAVEHIQYACAEIEGLLAHLEPVPRSDVERRLKLALREDCCR